jgi:hypothetical protein
MPEEPDDENIDALSVEATNGTVIFSTERLAGVAATLARPQLLILTEGFIATQQAPLELVDDDGIPVTDRLGIGADDDVDGACGRDPESQQQNFGFGGGLPTENALAQALGGAFPALQQPAGLSVARLSPPDDGQPFTLYVQVTGWGQLGTPTDCYDDLRIGNALMGTINMVTAEPRSASQDVMQFAIPMVPGINAVMGIDALLYTLAGNTVVPIGGTWLCEIKLP